MMQTKYREYYNTSKTNDIFKQCKNHFSGGLVFIKRKGEFVMVPGLGKPTETALSGVERRGKLAMMHLETRHDCDFCWLCAVRCFESKYRFDVIGRAHCRISSVVVVEMNTTWSDVLNALAFSLSVKVCHTSGCRDAQFLR